MDGAGVEEITQASMRAFGACIFHLPAINCQCSLIVRHFRGFWSITGGHIE